MWQDLIFAPGTAVVALFLIPALYATAKPPLSTSISTAAVLFSFAFAHATLSLWFAAAASAAVGAEWSVLAGQRWRQVRHAADEEE